ncbi:MAG: hypothetical protein P4M12_12595 [Gammaproteobacteria bacterium]|nr:hypothetical protein [Gammaproteobacteria bacterium]
MQTRSTTQLMNEHLLTTPTPKKRAKISVFSYFQFVYVMINSLLNTYYDTSNEITDTAELEPNFLNTAWQAAIPALILSLYFSVCVVLSKNAQSKNFTCDSEDNDKKIQANTLTRKKRLLAYSYFLAEINNNSQPLILFCKLAGMKKITSWEFALTYLGVTALSALGSTQELLNTLVAFKEEDTGIQERTPVRPIWKKAQSIANLLGTFLKTTYSVGTFITDEWNLEKFFLTISWQGYAISLPLAIFFALCESLSHAAESDHFLRTNVSDIETAQPTITTTKLTRLQNVLSIGHFASDVAQGVEPPLSIIKNFNLANQSNAVKGLTYSALGLYSFFGNVQELKNTRQAFQEENDVTTQINFPPQ